MNHSLYYLIFECDLCFLHRIRFRGHTTEHKNAVYLLHMPGTLSGAVAAETKGEIILQKNVLFNINHQIFHRSKTH